MDSSQFDLSTEVSGSAMLALIQCVVADDILPLLHRHNINRDELDAESWYPLTRWLDVLDSLDEQNVQGMLTLVDIGRTYASTAYRPEQYNTLEDALIGVNDIYQMNHRNGYAGEYAIIVLGPGHTQVIDHTPYPENFTYGVLYGLANTFSSPRVYPIVTHNDDLPCRRTGGDSCTFDVVWDF